MRIAHVTDIHWFQAPRLSQLPGKRTLGTANLYLRGRHHHFPAEVQQALMEHLTELAPDAVVVTGDLTSQATPEEFQKAKTALVPVLSRQPSMVIPGNHDLYTVGSQQERRIQKYFGDWMHLGPHGLGRLDLDQVTVIGLDPNRPTWINASGVLPDEQLNGLSRLLDNPELQGRTVVIAIHYPIVDRNGEVYDGMHHGLVNASELIAVLKSASTVPAMLICGHQHHGFRATVDLGHGKSTQVVNCGSSGYAYLPEKRRAAAMNVYEIDGSGLHKIERYMYGENGFVSELGGAYATGR
jgi:3',5'-cyclic AMP phosphodiesterase CpdA